jgi:hypothetical protein
LRGGCSAKTKAIDHIWNNRNGSPNIKRLREAIGQSYQYTVLAIEHLKKRGLIIKEEHGFESVLKPNPKHPVVGWVGSQRVR